MKLSAFSTYNLSKTTLALSSLKMGGGTSKQQLILADFINAIRSGDYKEMIKIHGQNPKLGLINMKEKEVRVYC